MEMESKHTAAVLIFIGFFAFVWVIVDTVQNPIRLTLPSTNKSNCQPISPYESTGSIRCWSGGLLVYENRIYHNGGILCSTDGKAIKITGGKSLCIIESNQPDNWTPPRQ